jgi:hypothetical protein
MHYGVCNEKLIFSAMNMHSHERVANKKEQGRKAGNMP